MNKTQILHCLTNPSYLLKGGKICLPHHCGRDQRSSKSLAQNSDCPHHYCTIYNRLVPIYLHCRLLHKLSCSCIKTTQPKLFNTLTQKSAAPDKYCSFHISLSTLFGDNFLILFYFKLKIVFMYL